MKKIRFFIFTFIIFSLFMILGATNVKAYTLADFYTWNEIYSTFNIDGVNGGNPPNYSEFTITKETFIQGINNYHYYNMDNSYNLSSQKIGLLKVNGDDTTEEIGEWDVTMEYYCIHWLAFPEIVLEPGTYRVTDSHPGTWSWNSDSGSKGFTQICGGPIITTKVGEGSVSVDNYNPSAGSVVTITATPATEGYRANINIYNSNNEDVTESVNFDFDTNTFTMPNYFVKVKVEFELIPTMYTITVSDENHFLVDPSPSVVVQEGDTSTITIIVETGYRLKSVKLDGVPQTLPLSNNRITLTNVQSDHTIDVEAEKIPYTITVNNLDGATINPNGVIDVVYGDNKDITITANAGYKLTSVKVDDIEKISTLTEGVLSLTDIQADTVITATVEKITKTVTIREMENGTITSDKSTVAPGETVTLTVLPSKGYKLKEIKLLDKYDENPVTLNEGNTFTMPSYNVFISAEFELIYTEKTITKTEDNMTLSAKGTFSGSPELVITRTEEGNEGYNSLITLVKEDKEVIGSYDVSIIGGTYEGELELTFTVGKQYEGDKITIYHKKANGDVETLTATVKDGKVVITVSELSPFMLVADKEVVEQKDATPKTGENIYVAVSGIILLAIGSSIVIFRKKLIKK